MTYHFAMDVRRLGFFGIGTYIRNLLQALARLDSTNRYTLVTLPKTDPIVDLGSNFSFVEFPHSDVEALQNATFPLFVKKLKADLFHIPLNSVAYWMPRPYVVTIHDLSSITGQAGGGLGGTLHAERYRRGAMRAARVITVSQATRRSLESILGLAPERIRTIYSAPDPSFSMLSRNIAVDEETLQRYSIQRPFILYAGTIKPHKNVGRLIEAFAVIKAELENHPKYRDLRLVIIGDELSKFPAVRRAVFATRMERHVRFLGFVPIETLRVFYGAAELFAFPSLAEGFGLAPLEAMACGTPVVASDLPALVEAVGDAAELVSPNSVFDVARGLREVLLDEDGRTRRIQEGRAQAARFHWDDTARHVLDVYLEIVS